MPTIDLEDFFGAIDGNEASSKISLIVFQAILFSATAFVDLSYLQEAEYGDRRAARSDYYQKVKVNLPMYHARARLTHPATLRL